MRATSLQRGHVPTLSIKKKIIFSFTVLTLFVLLLYSATMVAETCLLYRNAKRMHYWWRGRMFAADPILGFAPVPNSRGAEICPVGEIPVRSDGEGFRIPAGDTDVAALGPPRAIALGCSFTYGSLCLAEETYPYNLSKELDINCVNAGVVSYGISQILIRARSLIP